MALVEGHPFPFVVTNVETEEPFLKIWAQTDETSVQSISKFLLKMQEKLEFAVSGEFLGDCVVPNKRCFARRSRSSDFYNRAKILGLRTDGMVKLHFIDYGIVSHAPPSSIRLTDGIPDAEWLLNLPDVASPFVLGDVMPVNNSWQADVVSAISNILLNNKYVGTFQNFGKYRALRFKIFRDDFAKMLIYKNMANYSSFSSQVAQPGFHSPNVDILHEKNWRAPAVQTSAISTAAPVQKVFKVNSFKAIQLEINSVHEVRVSYVEDGPCKFSVQLVESIPYLEDMMNKINSRSHLPLQEAPIAGAVCLGRQTYTNKLCRIVLNSPGDTSCKVYFADYGHHELLSFNNIYQIPDEFVIPNVYSIRFTLSGIMNWTVSPEMKDFFGGIVCDTNLKLHVCKGPMSPLTQYCDLFLHGKNIRDILIENFPDQCRLSYCEPKPLPKGAVENVFVTHVISPAKFFVQLEREERLLDQILDQIEKIARMAENINLSQVYQDMPCIALYNDDGRWYRASVMNVLDKNRLKVFYVDFGNEEIVSLNNLRAIPGRLINLLPKLAILCGLHGIPSESIDQELAKNFKALVLEEKLSLTVQDYVSNITLVHLHERKSAPGANGRNIGRKLEEFKAAAIQGKTFATSQFLKEKSDTKAKAPLIQRQRTKNKNVKSGDNRSNSMGNYEEVKNKFHSENDNDQCHRRGSDNGYANGLQKNRFDNQVTNRPERYGSGRFGRNDDFQGTAPQGTQDYGSNDRFGRNTARIASHEPNNLNTGRAVKENRGNKPTLNARFDKSFTSDKGGSDKDSDTSSRSSGRRNGRVQNRNLDEQRKYLIPEKPSKNFQRIGRWENEEHANHNKNLSSDDNISITDMKPLNQDSRVPTKEISRYLTSTPISKIPPPNITVGAVKTCELVFYSSPVSFYVQLCPDNEDLYEMADKMQAVYHNSSNALQASEIKVNLQCVAQYLKDNLWYRAVVKSVDSSSAGVHFVDYGNTEIVSLNKIRQIEAEFLKLPAQAVHCKLYCPSKLEWSKEESDAVSVKLDYSSFEAEFFAENNGVYEILVKEGNCGENSPKYVNDLFSNQVESKPNYAALNEKWLTNSLTLGNKYKVLMGWFTDPENFYCQLESPVKEFRQMMNEIQTFYARRSPVHQPLEVGSSVIAILEEDSVLYRAEVLEINKPGGLVIVQYIDYGDKAMLDPRNIYPVEQKFRILPKQAMFCSLKNIAPPSGSTWTDSSEINKIFHSENLECVFHEFKENKYFVSLSANDVDFASALISKNVAVLSSVPSEKAVKEYSTKKQELPRIDIHLLEGQTLLVKVSHVEGVSKFYVQFYTAETCQSIVDDYMAKSNPEVMPRLLSHEVCIGAGSLVYFNGKWRRSVVINCSKPNYEVRFIDTGEHEKFTLNSMLGLPGQLALMQNQATECALFDVPLSSKADDLLKTTISGKDAKIFVEKVECNRLVVRLFDLDGNKIKVVESQNTEKINPVCSMQILTSTHNVLVMCINNCNSVWLQRTAESAIEQLLLQKMFDFYSKVDDKSEIILEENELYAALSFDNNWYRVKVLKLKETEKLATALLIDYGNTEDVAFNNFRKLEEQFFLPHQLAIEVSLTVKLDSSDEEQQKILDPLLPQGKVFTAIFYNVNRKWIVELSEGGVKVSEQLATLNVVEQASKALKPDELQKQLPYMRVGERYKVFVSHIDSPSQLWLQRADDRNPAAELQRQLQEVAAASVKNFKGSAPFQLEEKMLCLAFNSFDNNWYRAEVIDVDPDIVTVRFVDYGNTDVIDNDTQKVMPLPEKWKNIRRYAFPCKLDVSPGIATDDWSEEACKKTSDLLLNDKIDLEALIIADKVPMRLDLFLPDEQSICKILIDAKLALSSGISEFLPKASIDEIADQKGDEEEVQLDPRSAFTCHIISIDEFWMQEEKSVNELEAMEDRLMMASMFPPLTEIKEGLMCVAKYNVDDSYYRAVILSQEEIGAKVLYTDYGNTAVNDDLRVIPDDLAKSRPLARKCRLAKPDTVEKWPENVDSEFKKLSDGGATVFLLDVLEEGETCLVKLTLNSKDIALELLDLCANPQVEENEAAGIEEVKEVKNVPKSVETVNEKIELTETNEERLSPIGQENSVDGDVCVVTFVNSPSEFWVQYKSHFPLIDKIDNKLTNAESFDVASKIEEGKILAAKYYKDQQWYRSKVISYNENGTDVVYIDYGNSALIESNSDLRELPEELAQPVAQCTRCSLKLPDNFESWPEEACETFVDLTSQGKELKFKILSKNNESEPTQISLFDKNQDIVEILLNTDILNSEKELIHEVNKFHLKDSIEVNVSNDSVVTSEGQNAGPIDNLSSTSSYNIVDRNLRDCKDLNTTGDSAFVSETERNPVSNDDLQSEPKDLYLPFKATPEMFDLKEAVIKENQSNVNKNQFFGAQIIDDYEEPRFILPPRDMF